MDEILFCFLLSKICIVIFHLDFNKVYKTIFDDFLIMIVLLIIIFSLKNTEQFHQDNPEVLQKSHTHMPYKTQGIDN